MNIVDLSSSNNRINDLIEIELNNMHYDLHSEFNLKSVHLNNDFLYVYLIFNEYFIDKIGKYKNMLMVFVNVNDKLSNLQFHTFEGIATIFNFGQGTLGSELSNGCNQVYFYLEYDETELDIFCEHAFLISW